MAEYVVLRESERMGSKPIPYAALTHVDGVLTAYGDENYMAIIKKAFENDREKKFVSDNPADALKRRTTGGYSENLYFSDESDLTEFNNAVAELGYEPQVVFGYEVPASSTSGTSTNATAGNASNTIDTSKFSSVRIVNNG